MPGRAGGGKASAVQGKAEDGDHGGDCQHHQKAADGGGDPPVEPQVNFRRAVVIGVVVRLLHAPSMAGRASKGKRAGRRPGGTGVPRGRKKLSSQVNVRPPAKYVEVGAGGEPFRSPLPRKAG